MASAKYRIRKFGGVWWLFAPGETEPIRCVHTHEQCVEALNHLLRGR